MSFSAEGLSQARALGLRQLHSENQAAEAAVAHHPPEKSLP